MTPSEKKPSTTRLATAVPGALGAVLLIGAVAFGASSLRSAAQDSAAQAAASAPDTQPEFGATVAALRRNEFKQDPNPQQPTKTEAPTSEPAKTEVPKATEAPKEEAKAAEQPKVEPTAKPKPAPVETKKPAPAPTAKPAPAPANPAALVLEAWAKETKVKLAWTPFSVEGFEYFKVVRSADANVTWPASGDDEVVGVIGDPNAPWHVDKPACGVAWNYRVFAVRHGDGGYVTLAASNVASATTACAPTPAPIVVKPLAFQLNVAPGAGITLSWEACWSDGFVAYKVVRSAVNADPRYPLNDGTELIAAIGDPNATVFTDTAVAAGQTWIYRVVAVTDQGAGYVPLCETAAMSATAQ
jgi:outer membrane biosynthesis protein TonB